MLPTSVPAVQSTPTNPIKTIYPQPPGGVLPDFQWLRWKGEFNKTVLKNMMSGSGKIDKSIVEVLGADRYRQVKKKSQRLNSEDDIYGVELVFPKVSMSDAGLYTCVVMNHLGYDYKTTKLSVL